MNSQSNEQQPLTLYGNMARLIDEQKRLVSQEDVDWEQYLALDQQLTEVRQQIEACDERLPAPGTPMFETLQQQLQEMLNAQQELEQMISSRLASVTKEMESTKKQQKAHASYQGYSADTIALYLDQRK